MKWIVPAFILSAALFFGCTTSRGTLFQDVVEDETPTEDTKQQEDAKDASSTIEKDEEKEEKGLSITSYPEDAEVYIDNDFYGYTPLLLEELESGNYHIEILLDGYQREEVWLTYDEDSYTEIELELKVITGFIELRTEMEDLEVYLDGERVSLGILEWPVGEYVLRARKFGYEDFTTPVTVRENRTVNADIVLEKAYFAIRDVSVSRKTLNPDNPGNLGKSTVTFQVSTYGNGSLAIRDVTGTGVLDHEFPRFTTWEQTFTWDGRDSSGTPVPDGEYRIVISGTGEGESEQYQIEEDVIIDRSAVISFRPLLSGISGLLFAPTPEALPKGTLQFSTVVLGHFEDTGSTTLARFPVQLGVRFSPVRDLELNVQGTAFIQTSETKPFSLGVSAKYNILRTSTALRIAGGVTGKATWLKGETYDSLTNYTGVHLGSPWMFTLGPASLAVMPEFALWLSERITYPFETVTAGDSFFFPGAYLRTGLLLDFGSIWGGLSTALRTLPFTEGFGIHLPFSSGVEVHVLIPKTQFVLSAAAAMEFASADNFYIMGGIGLGFIN